MERSLSTFSPGPTLDFHCRLIAPQFPTSCMQDKPRTKHYCRKQLRSKQAVAKGASSRCVASSVTAWCSSRCISASARDRRCSWSFMTSASIVDCLHILLPSSQVHCYVFWSNYQADHGPAEPPLHNQAFARLTAAVLEVAGLGCVKPREHSLVFCAQLHW